MRVVGTIFLVSLSCFTLSCKNGVDLSSFPPPNSGGLPTGVTPVNPNVNPVAPVSAIPVKGIIAVHTVEIGAGAVIDSDIAVSLNLQNHHQGTIVAMAVSRMRRLRS